MNMRWRAGDLVHAIPIRRHDLNQAISRDGFRPEHTPELGKDRWFSWRDVVAVAVAQELRHLGHGPLNAFGLVQKHLSQFLRANVDQAGDCTGVLWLIYGAEDRLKKEHRCEFVQHTNFEELSITPSESAFIVVNVGRIANQILKELQADGEKLVPAEAVAIHQSASSL